MRKENLHLTLFLSACICFWGGEFESQWVQSNFIKFRAEAQCSLVAGLGGTSTSSTDCTLPLCLTGGGGVGWRGRLLRLCHDFLFHSSLALFLSPSGVGRGEGSSVCSSFCDLAAINPGEIHLWMQRSILSYSRNEQEGWARVRKCLRSSILHHCEASLWSFVTLP